MLNKLKSNKGFTLIELLIALAVFSLLVIICGMIMSKVGVIFGNVYNQAKYGATVSNIVSEIRSEAANGAEVELLPLSTDYSSYMTFDYLCKDASGTLTDFKGKSSITYKIIACDKDAGLKFYTITCNKASSSVTIDEESQYTYEQFKDAVPIIRFKKNTGAPDTLLMDVRLYKYDSSYIDDGTAIYKNPDSTDREYNYGLNTEMSFQNSTDIKAAAGSDVYVRAIKYRVVE